MVNKSGSVRKVRDVVEVRIFSDNVIVWKATAPISNKSKISELVRVLNSKWLNLDLSEVSSSNWWD